MLNWKLVNRRIIYQNRTSTSLKRTCQVTEGETTSYDFSKLFLILEYVHPAANFEKYNLRKS